MDNLEYILCPFCSEEIKVKAIKCRHCQSTLDEESVAEIEKIRKEVFQNNVKHKNEENLLNNEVREDVEPEEPNIDIHTKLNGLPLEKKSISWKIGTYVGQVMDGMLHGQGVMTLPDGHQYEGEWFEGKKHGEGILIYPTGKKYAGKWVDDEIFEEDSLFCLSNKNEFSGHQRGRVTPDFDLTESSKIDEVPIESIARTYKEGTLKGRNLDKKTDLGEELMNCPLCSGKILSYAIKCKHCGSIINNISR
jgi:hypothetical protein